MSDAVNAFMQGIVAKNPGEKEFHQAVSEVAESLMRTSTRTEVPEAQDSRAYRRTGAGHHVPGSVAGRQGRVQVNRGFRMR